MASSREKLLNYIQFGLDKGRSKEEISKVLESHNYAPEAITAVFEEYSSKSSKNSVVKYGVVALIMIFALAILAVGTSIIFLDSSQVTSRAISDLLIPFL